MTGMIPEKPQQTDSELLIQSLATQIGNMSTVHAIELANRDLQLAKMQNEVTELRKLMDSMAREMASDTAGAGGTEDPGGSGP